jgi:NADPH:quinone reductase-like Zn-dependent oxidoreductase
MKAITYTEYGSPDVLRLTEVPQPMPARGEVLVRVHAASVNYGDMLARRFGKLTAREFNMALFMYIPARLAFGLNKPRNPILGSEFSGHVAAVGEGVTRFKVGDAVFGYRGAALGTYVEYLTMRADGMIAPLPSGLTLEEAATVPYGALTALTLLRKSAIKPGQRVLIIGASGSIGAAAVQLAKHQGAHVTGVCGTPRVAFVRALGADQVIDYTREDFTQNGQTYDLIVDVLGKGSFGRSRRSLTPEGRYLFASFKMKQILQALWTSRFSKRKVICTLSNEKPSDLQAISELIEAGHYRAIVDRAFPMEQAAEAHRYAESGGKQAPVVIRIAPEPAESRPAVSTAQRVAVTV